MSVPNWAFVLTIELIILLILAIVFLAIGWRLSCRKKQKLVDKLQIQINQQNNQIHSIENSQKNTEPENTSKDLQEEVELLKIQLQQARDNPFLQEKIDALTAENEDLQAQLSAYKALE